MNRLVYLLLLICINLTYSERCYPQFKSSVFELFKYCAAHQSNRSTEESCKDLAYSINTSYSPHAFAIAESECFCGLYGLNIGAKFIYLAEAVITFGKTEYMYKKTTNIKLMIDSLFLDSSIYLHREKIIPYGYSQSEYSGEEFNFVNMDSNFVAYHYTSTINHTITDMYKYNPQYIIENDSIAVFYEIEKITNKSQFQNQFFAYKTDFISHMNLSFGALSDFGLHNRIMLLKCKTCESNWPIDFSKFRILHDTIECTCKPREKKY